MLDVEAFCDSLNDAELAMLALTEMIERQDRTSTRHCKRLSILSVALGDQLGLQHDDRFALQCGGFLHDIGKILVPATILFKAGPLNEEEWRIMREHTIRGERICKPIGTFKRALPIIRNHHERWDGSGYPDGLSGESIPLLARILQTADVYDALTAARPYKPPLAHDEAVGVMGGEARRGWRDPTLVRLLADLPVAELDALAVRLPESITDWRSEQHESMSHPQIRPVDFYSCFISHSSRDAAVAQKINDDLRANGIKCWYAPEDLKIGDVLRQQIDKSIKHYDKLLLILSRSSVNSRWVQSEVEAAFEEERHRSEMAPEEMRGNVTVLFPIRIDDAVSEIDGGWAADVRRTRHIGDFRDWRNPHSYDVALKRLLRDLAASDEVEDKARRARRLSADLLRDNQ